MLSRTALIASTDGEACTQRTRSDRSSVATSSLAQEGDQRVGEEPRCREAVAGVAGERLLQHRHQPLGQTPVDLVERVDAAIADRQQHRELPAAGEERLAEKHLRQHRRQREEIRPVIERLARHLLGREVGELPLEHGARLVAHRLPRGRARDAEVTELHPPFLRQVEVRRGDVACE